MKKFTTILSLIILGALAYQFRAPLERGALILRNDVQAIFAGAPCQKPLAYTLGNFSTKFNISQSYFLSALAEAEAIWEKPSGINLFTYVPDDKSTSAVKVNLVYDYRQQATSKLASLGITVAGDRASYDSLKAKLTSEKASYNTQKQAFDAELASFNQRNQAYEAEVQSWNKKGGAPQSEYNRLQAEKAALDAEAAQLQAKENSINNMVDEINALVTELNSLAATLNISVDNYNTINGARGESFEEGVYISDGISKEIDIYEFSSREKLVRVLAHELGHALGLEHVADPKAIMYKLNQGNSETLTKADLAALKTVCKIK